MKLNNLFFYIFAVIVLSSFNNAYADDQAKEIFVSNAWVQAMPPSQTTTAAYFVITNNSSKEAILDSASSAIAGSTEIHQMSDMNGMMNMAMVSTVHIPAMAKITFQPGGFHLMLINLKKPVNKGDIVPITLHFQDGSTIIANAAVKSQDVDDASNSMSGMKM